MSKTFALRIMSVVGLTSAALASFAYPYNGAPTGHLVLLHNPVQIASQIAAGWRPTSVEVELNMSAVSLYRVTYVQNVASHSQQVQFANVETQSQINARRSSGWRIEDVEVLVSGASPRFSAVMVRNVVNPQQTTYFWDYTSAQVTGLLNSYGGRLIDLDRYPVSGNERYSGVMVKNSGATAAPWGWGPAWTWASVVSYANSQNMRVIDLDRRPDGLYAVVFLRRNSGERNYYFGNRTLQEMLDLLTSGGLRAVTLNETTVNGTARYSGTAVNNTGSIAARVADLIIPNHNGFSGIYLRQMGGSTIVDLNGTRAFHPSSSIKVLVHYHAADVTPQSQLNTRMIGLAPMLALCRNMMLNSDNPSTNTLMSFFGKTTIQNNGRADAPMSTNTRLINNMGTGGPYNNNPFTTTTLLDMSRLYERIQVGNTLGATKAAWVRTNMLNETNSGFFDSVNSSVRSELGLTSSEFSAWRNSVRWIYKAGNNGADGVNGYWSCCGFMTLPFKSGAVVTMRTFLFGMYVNASTVDYPSGSTPTRELLREQIRASMATYN